MKIETIFEEYISLKRPLISLQTYRTNVGYYKNHIAPRFGDREINTIHYIDYQKFINDMLIDHKPKIVKNILVVLSTLYKYAKKMQYYTGDNIITYVELPRFDNKRYFTISKELQLKYIKALMSFDEPIYKDIFLFLLHGRRLNEVLDLEWQYLDLNQGIMYLPSAKNKSRKNLSFQLTDRLLEALKSHRDIAVQRQGTPFVTGHVFLNPHTMKRFSDLRKPFNRLLRRANLPKITMHEIRNLVTTYMVNELDSPIEKVSHTLGHSDITITQRYLNQKPQSAKEVMDNLFDSIDKKDTYIERLENDFEIAKSAKATALAIQNGIKLDKELT